MAYNRNVYNKRAKIIQEIAARRYRPENQSKCYKIVWKIYILLHFGIGCHSYL